MLHGTTTASSPARWKMRRWWNFRCEDGASRPLPHHNNAMPPCRDRDATLTGCTHAPNLLPREGFELYSVGEIAIPSRRLLAAKKNITPHMNKFERQNRQAADHDTLTDEISAELSHITTEVID